MPAVASGCRHSCSMSRSGAAVPSRCRSAAPRPSGGVGTPSALTRRAGWQPGAGAVSARHVGQVVALRNELSQHEADLKSLESQLRTAERRRPLNLGGLAEHIREPARDHRRFRPDSAGAEAGVGRPVSASASRLLPALGAALYLLTVLRPGRRTAGIVVAPPSDGPGG